MKTEKHAWIGILGGLFLANAVSAAEFPPFEELTEIQDPFSLRDPFLSPAKNRSTSALREHEITGALPTESELDARALQNIGSLDDLKIIGIITGLKKNRAMAEINGRTVILSEGMEIGQNGGRIIAIRERGLIYTEKQKNIYRKDEIVEKALQLDVTGGKRVIEQIKDADNGG